ncbi:EamA family transporter [Candidatus Woesearchaeota archaeon]|nr:EamA family transporter [Candidatus Woesearchaeota archaeon]
MDWDIFNIFRGCFRRDGKQGQGNSRRCRCCLMKTELWSIGLVLAASSIGSLGPLFLKKASVKFRFNIKELVKNYYLFLGIGFYGMGTVLFIPALRGGELSVLYPFVALVYVWVSLWSVKFLGERMTRLKWMGIALILAGVTFIGLGI